MKEFFTKYNLHSYMSKINTPVNYMNCQKLLHTLESIELIESTLSLYPDNKLTERNAFILLNLQFIGAAQESVSREFTDKYPELAKLGFTSTINEKNKSWYGHDRRAIAHSVDLSFIKQDIEDQQIIEELTKLKETIKIVLEREWNSKKIVESLIGQKLNFDPKVISIIYPNNPKLYSIKTPLENIFNILSEIQPYLKEQEKKILLTSPARQALFLFVEQVIGNNIRLYAQQANYKIAESMQIFIEVRNRIAHSRSFRDLTTNKKALWLFLKENFDANSLFTEEINNLLPKQKIIIEPIKSSNELTLNINDVEETDNMLNETIEQVASTSLNKKNSNIGKNKKEKLKLDKRGPSNAYEEYIKLTKLYDLIFMQREESLEGLPDINYKFTFTKHTKSVDESDVVVTYRLGNEVEVANNPNPIYRKPFHVKCMFLKSTSIPSVLKLDLLSYFVLKGSQHNLKTLILNYDIDLDTLIPNIFGDGTLLHYAVSNQNQELVTILLKNGADCNILNYLGVPPITYAIQLQDQEITLELVRYGSDIGKSTFVTVQAAKLLRNPYIVNNEYNPPFHGALEIDADLACKMLKVFLDQRQDLSIVKELLEKKIRYGIHRSDYSPIELLDAVTGIPDNAERFIKNVYMICKEPEKYEMHKYILFNDQEAIESKLSQCSDLQARCNYYTKRVESNATSGVEVKGYTIGELASAMENTKLAEFIKDRFKQDLSAKYKINTISQSRGL